MYGMAMVSWVLLDYLLLLYTLDAFPQHLLDGMLQKRYPYQYYLSEQFLTQQSTKMASKGLHFTIQSVVMRIWTNHNFLVSFFQIIHENFSKSLLRRIFNSASRNELYFFININLGINFLWKHNSRVELMLRHGVNAKSCLFCYNSFSRGFGKFLHL